MRTFIPFAIVILMSTAVIETAAQTLPSPHAVTDPKQIASKPNAQVEKNLSIEKLYMTRQVGGADWSPDGNTIVFAGAAAKPSGDGGVASPSLEAGGASP